MTTDKTTDKTVLDLRPSFSEFQRAEEIFRYGTGFFHEGLVAEALNMPLPDPPRIPFSGNEQRAACVRGNQLIWFPSVDAAGKPITMKRLHESFENKAPLGGKLLHNVGWYKDEPFFTEATARAGKSNLGQWRLVGQQAIPGAKRVNYLKQTIIGAKYVHDVVFRGNPPKHLAAILAEPAEREEEITQLMTENWQKAAEILANLPFNQLFRETPVEAFIRVIVNQSVNKIRLLESEYSWTGTRSSDGRLVFFGGADSDGASLDGWDPRCAHDVGLGSFLSRSENAGSES